MLMTIEKLAVHYGNQTALSIHSPLIIERGDRIGVIGSNGAGKTTLVKSLLGLISYQGKVKTELAPEDMAVHMQFNNYPNTMSVKSIMEAVLDTRILHDQKLKELIAFFDFEGCLKKKFSSLSGGQKQRLTIIMVMMQEAPLTFFDEVTSGLDFETRQKLVEKLEEWYRGKDMTLIIVSHYYEELEQLAKKILLLDEGRVIDFGETKELFNKYCGYAVVTVGNTEQNKLLLKDFPALYSPAHLLAYSCGNMEEEFVITRILTEHNINFKRSNHDIEIMSINAKQAAKARKEQVPS